MKSKNHFSIFFFLCPKGCLGKLVEILHQENEKVFLNVITKTKILKNGIFYVVTMTEHEEETSKTEIIK
jgi:hypothetical protein